jgi:ubiquinone/menaquinone biosynthesis C-methylase UbiE
MTTTATNHDAEFARIRAEYERRERELPAGFYEWYQPANLFRRFQIARRCIGALVREGMFPLTGRRVLDVGCGNGQWLTEFVLWGASVHDLCGIDLLEGRIQRARSKLPSADLRADDASQLPWVDATFDLVTQFLVFTSVLDMSAKKRLASEMLRVLKPDGLILWYDLRYNNPQNPNVRGIGAKEVRSLFPACMVKLEKAELAPPIARRVVPVSWVGALVLEKVPLLRTHLLGVISKLP